jgi:uncharacterized protein
MRTETIRLSNGTSGTERSLTVYHFGNPSARPMMYVQAALHADELPGVLVAHTLREKLATMEASGELRGRFVVVPLANPIGLSQGLLGTAHGRFALSDGSNFNRHFPELIDGAARRLQGALTDDAQLNIVSVRAALLAELDARQPASEPAALKHALLRLALGADYVLDLHCDGQSVMHLYTGTPLAETCVPLANALGARCLLTAELSGDNPFDEAVSRPWWELARRFPDAAIPNACFSATVELRGEADVSRELAERDADAIIAFAAGSGLVRSAAGRRDAAESLAVTPLAGVMPLIAPNAGVVVFSKLPGALVAADELIAELVDAVSGERIPLRAPVSGVLYARIASRFVAAGQRVAKVAGEQVLRNGNLLSP